KLKKQSGRLIKKLSNKQKMEKELSPMFLSKLVALQEHLKNFLLLYQNTNKAIKMNFRAKTLKIKALYEKLLPIIQAQVIPDWIKNANCHPDEIPTIVKQLNRADDGEILRIKTGVLKKHKKDFATYLWRCYGVELTWKQGRPQFNIGRKYIFIHIGREYILTEKKTPQDAALGEARFRDRLARYNYLKGLILSDKLRDNVRHLQDVEKAKKYLEELELIMKEDKGGLPDYFYNIFNDDLRQEYKGAFNSAIQDWEEGAILQDAIQEIETAYANVMEKKADEGDFNGEPEPLDSQKDKGRLEDFSNLPLSTLGEGDDNEVAMNDVQQGETGDCYMLAAAAALAKVAPQLLTGENGLIKDKGDYLAVTLYMKSSKFEYEYEPVVVNVSKNVLVDRNNQPLNQKLADGELWAVVLEKALAQHRGGYDNIMGGFAEQGLGMLTGKRAQRLDFKSEGEQDTLDFLKQVLEQGNPVTFSTKGDGAVEAQRQIVVQGVQQLLLEKHTYALEKIEGTRIHLYNPQGSKHLKIDFEALEEYFKSVYYTEL
ncbi:MAG: C2 family cysteine protease, partial [Aureispira sp.]